jgi:integrase
VPLGAVLVAEFRRSRPPWADDDDLVFRFTRMNAAGNPASYANIIRRILKPVAEEVGAPWAGFHTFRHTCASMLFARGANAKQVQRWLGHHSPSFTLDRYVHLLSDDLGAPLSLTAELPSIGGNKVATQAPETDLEEPARPLALSA